MTNPLRTPEDYELFLYTLAEQFSSVRSSTVTFVRRGATLARVTGELYFEDDIRLVIRERVLYPRTQYEFYAAKFTYTHPRNRSTCSKAK